MKTIIIDGKEIRTNLHENYSRLPDSMCATHLPFGMGIDKFFEQKVKEGYTTITFYYTTTCVRGYHEIYAHLKRG